MGVGRIFFVFEKLSPTNLRAIHYTDYLVHIIHAIYKGVEEGGPNWGDEVLVPDFYYINPTLTCADELGGAEDVS